MNDLTAIRQRAEATAPPPWTSMEHGVRPEDGPTAFRIVSEEAGTVAFTYGYSEASSDAATFIAHARTDIPYLLDRLEKAQRQAAGQCDECGESFEASGGDAFCTACRRKLLDRIEAAERALGTAREALADHEWVDGGLAYGCEWCQRRQVDGHAPDCKRQQALAELAAVLGTEER